jgi:hypothetical protein
MQDEIFAVCSTSLALGPLALDNAADLPSHRLLHSIGFTPDLVEDGHVPGGLVS